MNWGIKNFLLGFSFINFFLNNKLFSCKSYLAAFCIAMKFILSLLKYSAISWNFHELSIVVKIIFGLIILIKEIKYDVKKLYLKYFIKKKIIFMDM